MGLISEVEAYLSMLHLDAELPLTVHDGIITLRVLRPTFIDSAGSFWTKGSIRDRV